MRRVIRLFKLWRAGVKFQHAWKEEMTMRKMKPGWDWVKTAVKGLTAFLAGVIAYLIPVVIEALWTLFSSEAAVSGLVGKMGFSEGLAGSLVGLLLMAARMAENAWKHSE